MQSDCRLDFLFATWEGGGNIPPALTVVRALSEAGHRVRVICDSCSAAGIEAAGGKFIPWQHAPNCTDRSAAAKLLRDWEAATPADGFGRLRDAIMFGPAFAYAQDVITEIERCRPDLVVSSEMLFGVLAACEAQDQPLTLLATNLSLFPIPGIPPFGAGLTPARTEAERKLHEDIAAASREMFNAGLPALNDTRRKLGLHALSDVLDQLKSAERLLLATSRAFDFPADRLPEHFRYVGPQLDEPHWALPWRSPWPADESRPLVLVAFSSTFQNQSPVLRRVIDALAALPIRAVVTVGPGLEADFPPIRAENIAVCTSAPHDAIMREATAVITHAGHGTVMRALTHGLPLLCMPMGRDQNDNTVRVLAHKAGLSLSADAPADEISIAVSRLVEEPRFARSAEQLGEIIAAESISRLATIELTLSAIAHRNARRNAHSGTVLAFPAGISVTRNDNLRRKPCC
jgi:MGT family glycosyltransferase